MRYLIDPLKKVFNFRDRASRKEFWMFTLMNIVAYTALLILLVAFSTFASLTSMEENAITNVIWLSLGGMYAVVMIVYAVWSNVAGLALSVRRLHDTNFRGWWLLISFIPFGGLVLFVLFCIKGQEGPNRFGEDPYGYGAVCDDNLPSSIG